MSVHCGAKYGHVKPLQRLTYMDMRTRNQYLHALITEHGGYHTRLKKDKTALLGAYCRITGQHRKAVSAKIRSGAYVYSLRRENGETRRTRSSPYTREVTANLITLWEIFDRSCGQRLVTQIRTELARLRRFGELTITDARAALLAKISARTIDTKLKIHKEKERIKRTYAPKKHPLLYEKIPVKLSADQGRAIGATVQIDLVEHCGQSAQGPFISTLSVTDIGSGWWEGEPVMGKSAWAVERALGCALARFPFPIIEIHADNGSEFINAIIYRYVRRQNHRFSRSRPYAKNDNCFIEQQNSTHVRRIIGHRRYDTKKEYEHIKALYRSDLRLYKNFFQPIIPLVTKIRDGGKIRRTYGEPKTPYRRIMDDPSIEGAMQQTLTLQYNTLNPAELKRNVTAHQDALWRVYHTKQDSAHTLSPMVEMSKKLTPRLATFLIAEPIAVRQ